MTEQLNTLVLSEQQQAAFEAAKKWLEDFEEGKTSRKFFVLEGFAGTGKSFTLKHIINELGYNAAYMAYTGKAALVLRKYSNVPATTIHSAIYKLIRPSEETFKRLYQERDDATSEAEKKELTNEINKLMQPQFRLDTEAFDDSGVELIALDECSMVDKELLADLTSFGIPIFALGDSGQLPPVRGTGALFEGLPDAQLTDIRRQGKDSPIIEWSFFARKNRPLPPTNPDTWKTDEVSKIPAAYTLHNEDFMQELFDDHDIAICWKNKTRQDLNLRRRRQLGYGGTFPEVGETLQITKNDKDLGVFNGQFAEVTEVGEVFDTYLEVTVLPEGSDKEVKLKLMRYKFEEYFDPKAKDSLSVFAFKGKQEADFGYAITCHKAQGSQWERVLVFEENAFNWNGKSLERSQWLYTAITRAAQKLTVIAGKI